MDIIKPGDPKKRFREDDWWWVGLKLACKECGCHFELEKKAEDMPQVMMTLRVNPMTLELSGGWCPAWDQSAGWVYCPSCKHFVVIQKEAVPEGVREFARRRRMA